MDKKYLAHPKIRRPKPSLVALDGFHLLLSTQVTADLTLEWSGGSMFHLLSHIYAKSPFCCVETCKQCSELLMHCCFWSTVSKHNTHFEYKFFIDKYSCKMVNTLPSDIFNSPAISCNFNLWLAKTSLWSFSCFLGQLPNLGELSIQLHLCLYNCI